MSTPTPRTKPIDLSKCKVGQRVKLRNGVIRTYNEYDPNEKGEVSKYPYRMGNSWYCPDGRVCYNDGIHDQPYDIVAILPLPKKAGKPGKKAPKRMQKALAAFDTIDVPTVRRCIKLLEGLLKP